MIFRYLLLIKLVFSCVLLFPQVKRDIKQNADSTASIAKDTTAEKKIPRKIGNLYLSKQQPFNDQVDYTAKDSIKYDLQNKQVLLYGAAEVTYGDIKLKADKIIYGFTTNEVLATPVQDSSGALTGRPVFNDKGQEFGADTIR